MKRFVVGACLLALFLACSCGRKSQPAAVPVPARVPGEAESTAWSLAPAASRGMNAVSSAVVKVDRGDSPVVISDTSSLTVLPGGDFSFQRTREHKGGADGPSMESTSAILAGRDYFTAGSSGLWVRWDDAIGQPRAQVDSFIRNEDSLAAIVRQCAVVGQAAAEGRSPLSLASPGCRFATIKGAESTKAWSGSVSLLDGFLVLDGRVPLEASVRMTFETTIDGVPAAVDLAWNLKVRLGAGLPVVSAPSVFSESRRPRPVRMVESVLGGMVGEWGPGAPGSLAKPAAK